MISMLMLYHEHDEDVTMRPKPIGTEQRENVIESMAIGLVGAYRYFRQQRKLEEMTNVRAVLGRNISVAVVE